MAEDSLSWLQAWYLSQCNGRWEHDRGVEIGTVDNPGWAMVIDLTDTALENVAFNDVAIERSDDDWLFCEVTDNKFKAVCGPTNLAEAIERFRSWSGAHMPCG